MKRAVLGPSAVIAFFENRPGAENVEELISLAFPSRKLNKT